MGLSEKPYNAAFLRQKGREDTLKAVRIESNGDGTYSAYIYDHCIYTGTYEQCQQELSYHGESV